MEEGLQAADMVTMVTEDMVVTPNTNSMEDTKVVCVLQLCDVDGVL